MAGEAPDYPMRESKRKTIARHLGPQDTSWTFREPCQKHAGNATARERCYSIVSCASSYSLGGNDGQRPLCPFRRQPAAAGKRSTKVEADDTKAILNCFQLSRPYRPDALFSL